MTDADTPYVTLEQMADFLLLSPQTLRIWIRNGTIPADTYIKGGRAYRFHRERVVAALHGVVPEQLELPFDQNNA